MQFRDLHPWDVTPQEAITIQQHLREQVICQDRIGPVRLVAGVDVGFVGDGKVAHAAVAVLSYPDLSLLDSAVVSCPVGFPYIPGLLSFREVPAILQALSQLNLSPDLLLCDGQGIAHPRRMGLASHLGLICDLPSIGVAKSRLIGEHAQVGEQRGDWQPLLDAGEGIGAALRTRPGTRPLYLSIGHRISLEACIGYVLDCTPKYRLPETTRWAHRMASA
jgi:deoxyribonuclease V